MTVPLHPASAQRHSARPCTDAVTPPAAIALDAPCGPDLGYAEVALLLRRAEPVLPPSTGAPEGADADAVAVAGVAEPDWAAVCRECESLASRTHDLRVAACHARARLSVEGLRGFADGLARIAALLDAFWPDLHPRVEADDAEAIERRNVLALFSLASRGGLPSPATLSFERAWRGLPVMASPGPAPLTLQALVAGEPAPGRIASCHAAEPTGAARVAGAVAHARDALARIDRVFRRETGEGSGLDGLDRSLERLAARLGDAPATSASTALAAPGAASPANAIARGAASPPGSLDEAVLALRALSAWVRGTQPSSPAPLFIDRAAALLQLDFAGIVRELLPQSREQLERLGGVSLDAEPVSAPAR